MTVRSWTGSEEHRAHAEGAARRARVRAREGRVRRAAQDVNPEQLRDLGFQLEGRAPGGESGGAWFAIAADGARVVLKWFADEGVADRYAVLLPAIDVLRSRGVPVPEYPFVRAVDGWTLSAQQVLPGRSFPVAPPPLVDRMIECISAAAGVLGGPSPAPALGW